MRIPFPRRQKTAASKHGEGYGPLRSIALGFLLFFGSFIIGLTVFVHWESVWSNALQTAQDTGKIPKGLQWSRMSDVGPLSFTLHDVRYSSGTLHLESESLNFRGISGVTTGLLQGKIGNKSFRTNSISMTPGLFTQLTVHINTGEELLLKRSFGGDVEIEGSLALSTLLPDMKLDGDVQLDGLFNFAGSSWPSSGDLVISSQELALPNALKLVDFRFRANLDGPLVTIEKLEASGPIPFECSGQATLNKKVFTNTTYSVKGSTFLGETPKPFTSKGRLNRFWKG
jgi:hypothetical protein